MPTNTQQIGQIQRPGQRPENVTIITQTKPYQDLQAMLDIGGEVIVPAGTHLITGLTVTTAVRLILHPDAIIKQAPSNNATMFTISTDNFSIEGGTVDFDKANNATQKFIFNFSGDYDWARFYNVHIKNGTDSGIEYVAGEGLVVDSCRFTSNDRGAVSCICAGANIVRPRIINNYCDFTGIQKVDGVFKNRGTVDGAFKIIESHVIGNSIECDAGSTADSLVGIEFPRWSERSVIADNTIRGGTIGISIGSFAGVDDAADKGPVGVTCTGNTLFDQELDGIELALNATDCVVANNTIDGNATTLKGILVSGSQVAQCKRNLIANNTIRNMDATTGRCIDVASGADEISVIGNYLNISGAIDGIRFTNSSKNNAIKNNTIDCDSTGNEGITLDNCAGIDISGNTINDAQVDSVKLISASADTFVDGDVNTTTDRITLSDHFHADSQAVTLTTSGTLPGGISLATTYYVKSIDKDTIELYVAADLAVIVDITSAAGGGTHTITRDAVNLRITNNQSFNAGTAFFRNAGNQVYGVENRITNNIGVEAQTFIASDATPSVLIGDQFLSSTTGVTITQFDDGYAGQEITIISKGATVFDTSTATRLRGSTVDITTASGDITTWTCEVGGTSSSRWNLKGFVDVSVNNSAGA